MTSTTIEVPGDFKDIKKLVVVAHGSEEVENVGDGIQVHYQAVPSGYRVVIPSSSKAKPNIDIANGVARISLKLSRGESSHYVQSGDVIIYGPSLEEVDVQQGYFMYLTEEGVQEQLAIITSPSTGASVFGEFKTLKLTGGGTVSAEIATIHNLIIRQRESNADFEAGVVSSLEVNQPEVCPSRKTDNKTSVRVDGLVAEEFLYNGRPVPAKSMEAMCGEVRIGEDDEE